MSDETDDIEALRRKNKQERDAFLASFMNDPVFVDMVKQFKSTTETQTKNINKVAPKRKKGDSVFRFTGAVPNERRSSARLQNQKPDFTHLDLPDENAISHDSDLLDDLEDVVFSVKKRKSVPRSVGTAKVIPVEEVTEKMIENIQTSGNKVYGGNGTSCHQCRQKTVDTKTICRSGYCIGVRGQFCGICVINRYGEDPIKALKDPNWQCYVCRGCCNCSFCRLKEGKRPTGILAPLAKANGYKSVMEFLLSLKGYGDYADPKLDSENLLGFEGGDAILIGKKRVEIKCAYDVETFKDICKLNDDKEPTETLAPVLKANGYKSGTKFLHSLKGSGDHSDPKLDPENLLGFEGRDAILVGKKRVEIKCNYDSEMFTKIAKI